MAGKFIVFEGIDTNVLSDQASRLGSWLRNQEGLAVVTTREPTDGPIGAQVHLVLNKRLKVDERTFAALCLADRMDHLYQDAGILQDLKQNKYVVCVRYLLSAYVYQSEAVSFEWLQQINQLCRWPDLTIFIDTRIESLIPQIVEREGYDSKRLGEHRVKLTEKRNNHLRVIEQCQKNGQKVAVISGNQPAAAIHTTCRDLVTQLGFEK